jgi:protocatechuate 3,4-dioxygenase beta subunit
MLGGMHSDHMRRREVLIAAGGLGLGAAFGVRSLLTPATALSAPDCLLQKEVTEGPYYLDLDLVRRNIKGDRRGTPLSLRFTVVDASTCARIEHANVEIWHADASGTYSGVSGNGGTYLRGVQRTDSSGVARFESIFPGWYRGRTPHIHMKVFVSGDEVHTGQVFFRPAVTKTVYAAGVYKSRGQQDTSNSADSIYREAGARALCALTRKGGGYSGTMTIGVEAS